jgi:hypothetical protein
VDNNGNICGFDNKKLINNVTGIPHSVARDYTTKRFIFYSLPKLAEKIDLTDPLQMLKVPSICVEECPKDVTYFNGTAPSLDISQYVCYEGYQASIPNYNLGKCFEKYDTIEGKKEKIL